MFFVPTMLFTFVYDRTKIIGHHLLFVTHYSEYKHPEIRPARGAVHMSRASPLSELTRFAGPIFICIHMSRTGPVKYCN